MEKVEYNYEELSKSLKLFKESLALFKTERKEKRQKLEQSYLSLEDWLEAKEELDEVDENLVLHVYNVINCDSAKNSVLIYGIRLIGNTFKGYEDANVYASHNLNGILNKKAVDDRVLAELTTYPYVWNIDGYEEIYTHEGAGINTYLQTLKKISKYEQTKSTTNKVNKILNDIFSKIQSRDDLLKILSIEVNDKILHDIIEITLKHQDCDSNVLFVIINNKTLTISEIESVIEHEKCNDKVLAAIIKVANSLPFEKRFSISNKIISKTKDPEILALVRELVVDTIGKELIDVVTANNGPIRTKKQNNSQE